LYLLRVVGKDATAIPAEQRRTDDEAGVRDLNPCALDSPERLSSK
jgi:hypothetical protein